jgi:hypothetical protein
MGLCQIIFLIKFDILCIIMKVSNLNIKEDSMSNKKIFTESEIVNVCKAFAIVAADDDGYLSGEELLSMNDEEAYSKLDSLSEQDKTEFMKQVNDSVGKQLELYRSLPDKVNTDEALKEHQSIIKEVFDNWVDDFENYIIDGD